jgi:predicted acyltransferase
MRSSTYRIPSIDVLRGFAILGMVLVNYAAGVRWIPAWFKHAPDVGYSFADLVAPLFIFAIGLTYVRSAQSRLQRDGAWKMTQHFITRYFAILGIGALFGAGEVLLHFDGQTINWGVLQAIGVAGLVTLVFIRTNMYVRLAAGLAILVIYQYMLGHYWLQTVLASPHGGLYGAISWSAMLLLATVLADLYHRPAPNKMVFTLSSALVLAAGVLLSLWIPISKNRVSATYVLVSLGLSGLLLFFFHILTDRFHVQLPLLVTWGKNPMLLYILHLLLLGFVALPEVPVWYAMAPYWLVFIQATVLLFLLSLVAWRLERRELYLSL